MVSNQDLDVNFALLNSYSLIASVKTVLLTKCCKGLDLQCRQQRNVAMSDVKGIKPGIFVDVKFVN